MKKFLLLSNLLFFTIAAKSQEKFIDSETKHLFDSLDKRISYLENQIPAISSNRDANYFATKRELDMTIFLRNYEQYVFDENLMEAERLIDQKIKVSQKRADSYAVNYYNEYQSKLTRLRGEKRVYYGQLLEKEKNFQKEFNKYIKVGDEYSLLKVSRIVDLALKYAQEQKMGYATEYLVKYKKYAQAISYDLKSSYDLKKLTDNEGYYNKTIVPLLNNDTLAVIEEAAELVEQCYNYSNAALTKLDTNYFATQRIVVANAIADWNERQGITAELAKLTGQAVVASTDSINREGIYRWNNMILVIGSVSFSSKSENVRRGEAIINSDQKLMNYIRVNKLSKQDLKSAQVGKSYMVSFVEDGKKTFFLYNQSTQKFQYMIAYSSVISNEVTEKMQRFLPPLQFKQEIAQH